MAQNLTQYILPLAILAVATALGLGLWNMLRGGSANRSQAMMRWRVILQLVAIIALMATLYFAAR